MDGKQIHSRIIPILYVVVWGLGLLLSIFGFTIFDVKGHSEEIAYLFVAYSVFLVFLGEVVLSFADIGSLYADKRIKGSVFWLFSRLFLIIILVLIFTFIYYKAKSLWFLIPFCLLMCWLKWKVSSTNNNMEKYVIDEDMNIFTGKKQR